LPLRTTKLAAFKFPKRKKQTQAPVSPLGTAVAIDLSRKELEENFMSLLDNAFGISAQALAFRSQRSSMLAANIANAETPNYLARDYDFRTVLERAASGYDDRLATSDDGHIDIGTDGRYGEAMYRVPTKSSDNANTVEEEIEQAAFSENSLRYQTSLQFLNGTIRGLRLAIKGE
jgi:flagellar basal-body rod protein FlgB